jgi:single-stranded-DNA-specific exonuclease
MATPARWVIPEIPEDEAARLARRCGLTLPVSRVLWSRDLRDEESVRRFLRPDLKLLHGPFLMKDMDRAVERVRRAVAGGEKMLLYGDYDVDGICSVVILKKMLEILGAGAEIHVPDRLKDGYGIQRERIEQAAREGVKLIISADTGIRSTEALARAAELGLDVIVTDHHLPEEDLPPACAILNPNQPGCPYPNKSLCGAGVVFKLIEALMEAEGWAPHRIERFQRSFLTMVAMATIADVVTLTGENRIIVKRGLEGLHKTPNVGLRALLEACRIDLSQPPTASGIGFRVAPRINAAGRMEHARDVIELFLTPDEGRARQIAARLDELNTQRKDAGHSMADAILARIAGQEIPPGQAGLVFYDPSWHRGVAGIVAGRIAEQFHRPTLVLCRDEATGLVQGSGRTTGSFHLLNALESMADLLIRFGGHKQAVGLTLEEAKVAELRERFNLHARTVLSGEDLIPERRIDAVVRAGELNDQAAADLLLLEPFGLGNRAPVLLLERAELRAAPDAFGREGAHLRLRLFQNGTVLFVKGFNMGPQMAHLRPGVTLDAAVVIEPDAYGQKRGFAGWAAHLCDFRLAGGPGAVSESV